MAYDSGLELGRPAQWTGPDRPGPTRPGPGQRTFSVGPGRPTEKDQWAGRAADFVGRPGPTTLFLLNFIVSSGSEIITKYILWKCL